MRFFCLAIFAFLFLMLFCFASVTAGESKLPGEDDFILVDTPAQMTVQATPIYPDSAKNLKIEGTVWVKALVDENGKVLKAKIAKCLTKDLGFEKAALDAAYKCEFTPAKKGDKAVPVWVTYSVKFELAETSEK